MVEPTKILREISLLKATNSVSNTRQISTYLIKFETGLEKDMCSSTVNGVNVNIDRDVLENIKHQKVLKLIITIEEDASTKDLFFRNSIFDNTTFESATVVTKKNGKADVSEFMRKVFNRELSYTISGLDEYLTKYSDPNYTIDYSQQAAKIDEDEFGLYLNLDEIKSKPTDTIFKWANKFRPSMSGNKKTLVLVFSGSAQQFSQMHKALVDDYFKYKTSSSKTIMDKHKSHKLRKDKGLSWNDIFGIVCAVAVIALYAFVEIFC